MHRRLLSSLILAIGMLFFANKSFSDIPATFRNVTNGDTFFSILRDESFTEFQIATALAQVAIPKGLALLVGDIYKVSHDPMIDRTEIKFFPPSLKQGFLFWREGRLAGGEVVDLQLQRMIETTGGVLGNSVIESIRQKTNSVWVAQRFVDGFIFDQNQKKAMRAGNRFRLTFEKFFDGAQLVRFGEVLWSSLEANGRSFERFYKPTKNGGLFVSQDMAMDQRPLYSPVDYLRVSSLFQMHRFHPIRRRYQAHLGIDFAVPEGTPIYAAYSGVVTTAGYNRAAGLHVKVEHPNGMESIYVHLESIDDGIVKGTYVPAGELVGHVGCTGYCTSPHLHFGVKYLGKLVDPVLYVRPYSFRQKEYALEKSSQVELLQPEN